MLSEVQSHQFAYECHACEPRGGCLGLLLLESEDARHQLSHAKKINRKAEHVFREGEDADCFFVVRSGSIKNYLVTEDGEEQVCHLGMLDPARAYASGHRETLVQGRTSCQFAKGGGD